MIFINDYETFSVNSDDSADWNDYEEIDADDEDKNNVNGNFDWYGLGTSSNVNYGDVVPTDSTDSEDYMESLSSEFDEG